MKWVKALALVVLFVGGTAFAQGTGAYWFSLSSDDPTPVICYPDTLYPGDVFTLHAWLSAESDWGWIGGFTFPIVYNADYIDVYKCVEGSGDSMTIDLNNLGPYMFKGIRFPCDTIASSPPGQAMWYAAVCFSGCPLTTDGTPHHIGSITFEVIDSIPPQCTTIIDTGMYPPSNYATMGDPGGTETIWPEWEPFGAFGPQPPTGAAENSAPNSFFLTTAGPNPFRTTTAITYGVAKKSEVDISVYDVTGRLVKTLVSGVKDAGTYTIQWNGTDNYGHSLASGTYFLRMTTDSYKAIRNLMILR